jgi:hypothetical protein
MPPDLDHAKLPIDARFTPWYAVWLLSEPEGVFKGEFAFDEAINAFFLAFGPFVMSGED